MNGPIDAHQGPNVTLNPGGGETGGEGSSAWDPLFARLSSYQQSMVSPVFLQSSSDETISWSAAAAATTTTTTNSKGGVASVNDENFWPSK